MAKRGRPVELRVRRARDWRRQKVRLPHWLAVLPNYGKFYVALLKMSAKDFDGGIVWLAKDQFSKRWTPRVYESIAALQLLGVVSWAEYDPSVLLVHVLPELRDVPLRRLEKAFALASPWGGHDDWSQNAVATVVWWTNKYERVMGSAYTADRLPEEVALLRSLIMSIGWPERVQAAMTYFLREAKYADRKPPTSGDKKFTHTKKLKLRMRREFRNWGPTLTTFCILYDWVVKQLEQTVPGFKRDQDERNLRARRKACTARRFAARAKANSERAAQLSSRI